MQTPCLGVLLAFHINQVIQPLHWISSLSHPYLTTLYIFNSIVSWSPKPSPLRIPWIHQGWTPADMEAWHAAVHGVTKSRTWLSDWAELKIPYDYTLEVTNRFKGLDLVDRVLEEWRTVVHNILQGVVTKTIPKKKICNKAKWLSEEALQIAEKRSRR